MKWYNEASDLVYKAFIHQRELVLFGLTRYKIMRRPERIPIVLANIDWEKFLTIADEKPSDDTLKGVFENLPKIKEEWTEYPDLRLGQLLINMKLSPDELWNLEEDHWMVETGQIDAKDIMFWGVNYTKDMVQLPETDFRLIRDLNTEHIEAILDGGYVIHNKVYEGYFENELERRIEEQIHDDE